MDRIHTCYIQWPSEPKARNFAHYYTRSQSYTRWSKSCQTDFLTAFKGLIEQFLSCTCMPTTPMPSKTFSDQKKQLYITEELNLFVMHFIMGLKKRSIVVPPLLHSSSTEPLHPFLPQLLEMLRSVNLGKAHGVQGKGHCTERGIVQKQAGPFPPPKKPNIFSLPRLKLKAEASRYQLSAPRPPSRAPPARRTLDPGAEVGERRAQPLRPPRASAPRGGHGSGRRPLRPLPGTFSSCRARRRPRGAGRRRRPPRRRRRAAAPRGPSPPLGPRRESFARPPAPCRSGARPAGPPRPPASPGGRVWLLRAELGERGPRRAGRLLPGERPAAGGVAPARPRPRGCRRHREAAGTGRPRRDPGGNPEGARDLPKPGLGCLWRGLSARRAPWARSAGLVRGVGLVGV